MLPPPLPLKTIGLGRLHPFGRVPQRMLPAIVQTEDRAEVLLYLIGRAGADRAAGLPLLKGKVDGKARAVGFQRPGLGEGLARPSAIARHVPGEHVILGLTVDDPLRQGQPQTARLRKAWNDAAGGVVVLELRDRPQQRSRVR